MYGISQENLYVDTGALRLNNVPELVDTFLSDHHQESPNNHQPEGKITHVTRKVNWGTPWKLRQYSNKQNVVTFRYCMSVKTDTSEA